ncbi:MULTISPECIES: L-histidine N(alpha)-methyltransferase [Thiorhodovibrio]|uniref:L-histidine N(alpha)-methyltransferase n=1 Tax=Thiorhodovibrio TaxID=61593 RepID=UPI0019130C86|nr:MULTISPECIES: L-histidine N(alpha)-methyltransferase [Thiorhodovibrio]MBK5969748.1 L-histidine N(alpha)-methyltransferase [Thiorhodovibrio winogradskyi]WPL13799.1 Histidine-specific methyltransferase EgtD [Thiorhodovibrio litoralis]
MKVSFFDDHPKPADIRAEVLTGLALPEKKIPPKFFYDEPGSRLFDAICELPEYYPTRTEISILRQYGAEMAELLGHEVVLIELGSGSSLKIRTLLEALRPRVYIPVDISREHLLRSAENLAAAFPEIEVRAACADYSRPFRLPLCEEDQPRAAFFPGSSVGNFEPADAEAFLRRVGDILGPGGHLLIGVDLRKSEDILHAAYNDAAGVTADFNLNLLTRINRELDGTFDPAAFHHSAFFNPHDSRIEMHLVSNAPQDVEVAGETFHLTEGESIHTECSYKYSIADFHALASRAGFEPVRVWTDDSQLFSVHGLRRRADI